MSRRYAMVAFRAHRAKAEYRGIDFRLTFAEWYQWWLSHGIDRDHPLPNVGDGLCMCRVGDQGAYELGNIYLATRRQNSSDARRNNPVHRRRGRKPPTASRVHTPAGIFPNADQAALHYNVTAATIRNRCLYRAQRWQQWYFVDDYQNGFAIQTPAGRFCSQAAAARAMAVPVSTIARRRKTFPDLYYYV